jgi:chaperone BCS1
MIQYDEHIQDSMAKNQLYFTMEDEEKLTYSEYIFDCNTTFDTIFFDKKDEVKKELDFFINNREFYEEKGLPYRYGMLLHGMPGCGKTSLIKAIAKYTGRHIVNINVNLIKDKKMLEDIFYNTKINKYSMTNDKKLYVIEEFDVNAIDLIKDRNIDYDLNKKTKDGYIKNINNSAEDISEEDTEKMLEAFKVTDDKVEMSLEHFRKIQTVSMAPPKKGMTLGDLLQVLDGLIECSGRMLIVTTNDFLKIDKALLRAGRIDKMIEFNRLNSVQLMKLYRFFIKEPSENVENYINEQGYDIIEAAEFVSICRNNLNNNEGLLKSLKNYISSK